MRNFTDEEIIKGVQNAKVILDTVGEVPAMMNGERLVYGSLNTPIFYYNGTSIEWDGPAKNERLTIEDLIFFWQEMSKCDWVGTKTRLLVRWQIKRLSTPTEEYVKWHAIDWAIRVVLQGDVFMELDDLRDIGVEHAIECVKYTYELYSEYKKEREGYE